MCAPLENTDPRIVTGERFYPLATLLLFFVMMPCYAPAATGEVARVLSLERPRIEATSHSGILLDGDLSDCCFTDCRLVDCNLSLAKVMNAGMRNVTFLNCKAVGVDFSKCGSFLFAVSFATCCLDYCGFSKTRLKKSW